MSLTKLPLTIAYVDSPRGRAYLQAFRTLKVYPEKILIMGKPAVFSERFLGEAQKYSYAEEYYDMHTELESLLPEEAEIAYQLSASINSDETVSSLRATQSLYVLYTGGGIVSAATLGVGKQFIHVHPGVVPRYRGSTCFYYSLIERNEVGATAFIMAEKLDEGPILHQKTFSVNIDIAADQFSFLDHVLDPYIRMKTLEPVLQLLSENPSPILQGIPQPFGDTAPYYVMHPLLRKFCWDKLKANFSPLEPVGVQEI